MTKKMSDEVAEQLGVSTVTGALAKIARKRRAYVPANDDPKTELRRLAKEHAALVKKSTAIRAMVTDRKSRETGEVIPCNVPLDAQQSALGVAAIFTKAAESLGRGMRAELRKLPVYQHFLQHVYGFGDVVCAYLLAYIDFEKATKPSNLRRFCGLAVIGGRLERPTRGVKLGYCAELRMRLFQGFSAMWKNAAKSGASTKYLEVWRGYKHRMQHSERIISPRIAADGMVDGKIVNGQGKTVSARGFCHSTGWHKAADVLIEDLYMIGRAVEGLPIWPSYYAAKLGHAHGGQKIDVAAIGPRVLSVEEVIALIGDVGKITPPVPLEDIDLPIAAEE